MSSKLAQVWCDVGGTFTDCFVVLPSGQRLNTKVLSSGVVKGTAETWLNENTFVDLTRRSDPEGFWIGADVRWLDDEGAVVATHRCTGFVASSGAFSIDRLEDVDDTNKAFQGRSRVRFELVAGIEAPVLATRLLLGCNLSEPLPRLAVRLGTTRGTNALLTRNGERCALVTTKGFADLVRIGYQERPELFALAVRKRIPLHHCVVEIDERLSADGSVLSPIDLQATERSLRELFQTGIRSLAVCLLHSYCNPAHELVIERIANDIGFHCVCISSQVSPKIKAVLRAETALVDAYLTPTVRSYLSLTSQQFGSKHNIDQDLRIRVMTSSGGLVAADLVRGKDTVLSGPAGGAVAIEALAHAMNELKCIGLDMGGTSTDVCRIAGKLQLEHETIKAGVRMMVPTLAIHTVAAGGGSVCWFDGVALRVGPQSAGADPGPACYCRGGPLTITDLNLLSNRIDLDTFPFRLDVQAATQRLNEVLTELNKKANSALSEFTVHRLIAGFRLIANEHMAAAVRSISIAQGADPREHALVGFGGAAGQHICEIAELIDIHHVIDPPEAGLLSALGMGLASIQRTLSKPIYQLLELCDASKILLVHSELRSSAQHEFQREGIAFDQVEDSYELELRYVGSEGTLMVPMAFRMAENQNSALEMSKIRFSDMHSQRFGYSCPGKPIELVSLKGEFRLPSQNRMAKIVSVEPLTVSAKPRRDTVGAVFMRQDLLPGQSVTGPALIVSSGSTTAVPIEWTVHVLSDKTLSIRRNRKNPQSVSGTIASKVGHANVVDPVTREVIAQRIAAIADQMGIVLEQTAVSVNVKDRRDFSCAVFASNGDLIANAPHVPVHLGAMSQTIRCLLQLFPSMQPGDCFVTNDPYQGGSHLPDITVVTPVFVGSASRSSPTTKRQADFFVACRAHHAEIGGVSPGSMAPTSTRLGDEGVVIPPMYLAQQGVDRSSDVEQLLRIGPYPSRAVAENMADLSAQQAANQRGLHAMSELADVYGVEVLTQYLEFIQQACETKTRAWIETLPETPCYFSDSMDDGTRISVQLRKAVDSSSRAILAIDFSGTGPVSAGNLNANPAIVTAAVMYVIRCAVADTLPLNSGVMRCVQLTIPPGILNPEKIGNREDWPAVAGGNVETSQRVVDCLLGALRLAAASQGTMNNFLFGDSRFGYYETIGGGTGATSSSAGEDAVHSHMTNTRLTDVEVLEKRYPVRLVRFEIRKGSGGRGLHSGGSGLIRQILALKPLDVSLVTSRRNTVPFGLNGGEAGKSGENWLIRKDGEQVRLKSSEQLSINAGDCIRIETPGGGGIGKISCESALECGVTTNQEAFVHPTAQSVRNALARAAIEGAWQTYEGPNLHNLRSVLSKAVNREHVRLCCSGTFAVELAVRSLHLQSDAEVILAGYDFPGNFRAIQDAGSSVVLCDVAEKDWVPHVAQLEHALGPKTKAVVVSHLHGSLAPMAAICRWARERGLLVVEDACQVHGASIDGKPAGAWGDLGVFSFGGSKLIAAGRGGAVVTNDARFAQRMTVYCERGNDSYALSELQAAVLVPQYEHLITDHSLRLQAADNLIQGLARHEWLSVVPMAENVQPAYYKVGIMLRDSLLQSTPVQSFVQNRSSASTSPMALAREYVLQQLERQQVDCGEGFRGFLRRSSNRCRRVDLLDNSRWAADATIVIHHSHLLDPQTGESNINRVLTAFDTLNLEISH
ncbi:MAG: aminotransferase class V-fold PLP-dependent enzyme [Planctomycetota bacterium]|nr:aminotransferase class V-fold PLP-dependent enzyme [Planctomycetota bacterium]